MEEEVETGGARVRKPPEEKMTGAPVRNNESRTVVLGERKARTMD